VPPKKDKPKDKPEGWNFSGTESAIVLLFLLALIGSVGASLRRLFSSGEIYFYGFSLSGLLDFFTSNIIFFKFLGFSIAGLSVVGTFVYTKKSDALWREMKAKVYPSDMPKNIANTEPVEDKMITRWKKISQLSESKNTSDWRVAIIEADMILDELLNKLQLPGDTMGEKLKAVEKSDFVTIEEAWEAHKARNAIAHQGDILLNQRETRRIVSLYEAVFKEFELI